LHRIRRITARNPNFGQIVSAAAPRLVQLAARFSF
jgi:hypothetical protein